MQARAREFQGEDGNAGRCGPVVFGLELADRPAGKLEHLEGADDPAAVVGMKAGRRPRVEGGQTLVERGIAVLEGVVLEPQAELVDRPLAPGTSRGAAPSDRGACRRRRGRACLAPRSRRRPRAAQSRYAETLADSQGSMTSIRWWGTPPRSASDRLGRRDIHPAVQGHRVERDHLGIQPLRQGHADSRLARGRRPGQVDRAVKDVLGHRSNPTYRFMWAETSTKDSGERRCRSLRATLVLPVNGRRVLHVISPLNGLRSGPVVLTSLAD